MGLLVGSRVPFTLIIGLAGELLELRMQAPLNK